VTFGSLGTGSPVILRVLVGACTLAWVGHASAGGLGDLLQAVESLDQSIQEKVQGVLRSTESTHQETSEEPDSETTATSVDSDRIRIKAEPRVASESVEVEEEDQEEPNVISSEIIRLTPDAILKEDPSGEAGITEGSQSVMSGSSAGAEDNRQSEAAPQTSKAADTEAKNYNDEQAGILWLGNATDIVERYGVGGGVATVKAVWQVRLREGYRLNIVDADDRLLGQLIRLDDDGSEWTASQFGQTICSGGVKQYGGGGSGVLVTDSPAGWVYYSLVDNDPLQDLLSDGAYYVSAHDLSDGSTFWSSPIFSYRSFLVGFRWSVENSNPIPDKAHDGMRVPVDLFRTSFRYFTGDYSTWDPEIRVLVNSQMSGSYLRPILTGTSKCVSKTQRRAFWSVDRIHEIKPSLEEVQRNWRPEYDNPANTLSVTASIEQPAVPGKFRFTLFDVTREKGWAMNAGDRDDDSLDLEFVDGLDGFLAPEETPDGWTIETNRTMTAATVVVKANDYGAWGKLKCEVNPGGHWFPCSSENGEGYVTIPRDHDENKIADFWEEQKGVSGDAAADDDETPEGREPGDGFSNYEEYRGFQIKGEWTDTDPKEKDLFVHNDADDKKVLIDAGIDLFETASELTVHKIEADEYDEERVVNFNRGEHQAITRNLKGQKGLHIVVVKDLGDDVCGEAFSSGSWLGGPNVTEQIRIHPSCITPETYYQENYTYDNTPGEEIVGARPITGSEYLDLLFSDTRVRLFPMDVSTVAHELGHGVNLYHPGLDLAEVLDECGSGTAVQGGVYSGPEANLMRYNHPTLQYVGGKCYKFPVQLDNAPQTAFVRELKGSGVNTGPLRKIQEEDGSEYWLPMAGDATCTGTLATNMSLNQDKKSGYPEGC